MQLVKFMNIRIKLYFYDWNNFFLINADFLQLILEINTFL